MASQQCQGKSSWPELVGTKGCEAPAVIKCENPKIKNVPVLKEGTPVTMDYRFDRVRVFVNNCGLVAITPTIG